MSYPKIKGRMAEVGVTQKTLSALIGIDQSTLSQKIRGVRPMYLHEAKAIAAVLNILDYEFAEYFFAQETAQRNFEAT